MGFTGTNPPFQFFIIFHFPNSTEPLALPSPYSLILPLKCPVNAPLYKLKAEFSSHWTLFPIALG